MLDEDEIRQFMKKDENRKLRILLTVARLLRSVQSLRFVFLSPRLLCLQKNNNVL